MTIRNTKISATFLFTSLALVGLTAPACETEGWEDPLDLLEQEQAEGKLDYAAPQPQAVSGGERKGRVAFGAWTSAGIQCETVSFNAFSSADVMRVQVGIDHEGSTQTNRDATTVWVEDVETDSIEICVRETDDYDDEHFDGLNVSYRVYDYTNLDPAEVVTGSTTGAIMANAQTDPTCTFIKYSMRADQASPRTFSSVPILQLTVTHPENYNSDRDAMTIWAKNVTKSGFTACVQETQHDDHNVGSGHLDYNIDWIAFDQGDIGISGVYSAGASFSGRQCAVVDYDGDGDDDFDEPPLLYVTIDDNGVVDDAITAWVEEVHEDQFELCYQELAAGDGTHTGSMDIHWVALTP